MTIEEKLDNFYEVAMESARQRSAQEMDTYRESLEKIFEEHKAAAERQAKLMQKTEKDEIRRISNMEVSREQLRLRHELSAHVEDLEARLFAEVEQMLSEFCQSPAYLEWLKKQIREELDFDPEAELRIYIDPSDEKHLEELKRMIDRENAQILISGEGFIGGSRGVIHSRNILIDNSLKKKLDDVRDKYQLREEL